MECSTILIIDGVQYVKPKAKYKEHGKANKVAAKSNRKRTATWAHEVYKCSECGFYHVGRNRNLKASEKRRLEKEISQKNQKPKKPNIEYVSKNELKIIGKIELPKKLNNKAEEPSLNHPKG